MAEDNQIKIKVQHSDEEERDEVGEELNAKADKLLNEMEQGGIEFEQNAQRTINKMSSEISTLEKKADQADHDIQKADNEAGEKIDGLVMDFINDDEDLDEDLIEE